MRRSTRRLGWFAGVSLVVVAAAEISLRAAGFVDFPIYRTDPEIGYLPQPSQRGAFMNRNRWFFNDRSMPVEPDWRDTPAAPVSPSDLLLIGNSIVMGGNSYDQPDKLAPQMQQRLGDGFRVWPLAVGGWTNVNQIAYLKPQHDVVDGAEFFVWQVMGGGFGTRTPWRGEYVFPTERPAFALWYVARRYVLPRWIDFGDTELPDSAVAKPEYVEAFDRAVGQLVAATRGRHQPPGLIYLFPAQAELAEARRGHDWLPERAIVTAVAQKHGLAVVDIAEQPEWNEGVYRDGVHLTVEGNALLAKLIARHIPPAQAAPPQAAR